MKENTPKDAWKALAQFVIDCGGEPDAIPDLIVIGRVVGFTDDELRVFFDGETE